VSEACAGFVRLAFAVWAAAMLLGPGLAPVAAADPQTGDHFEYKFKQRVDNGEGGYDGWWEETVSHGRYDVVSVSGSRVELTAAYGWTYDAYDYPKTPVHNVALNFSFSADTRLYLYGYDLDVAYGPDPSVWFWISPDVALGQQVRILDGNYTVESLDATVWSDWMPKRAIELVSRGSGMRDDIYGQMYYTYTDRYYMDRETGYIIAERYSEHDTGWWEGQRSSFDWHEDYDVVSSSYKIRIDWVTLGGTVAAVLGIFILIGLTIYGVRWRARKITAPRRVRIFRVRKMAKYPHMPNRASVHFGPFLEDFARKALCSGGRVAAAVSSEGLEGLALYHRDAKVGAIFCKDYAVNEALRKFVGAKDFFSEERHRACDSEINDLAEMDIRVGREAYNTFETSRVMTLSDIRDTGFDSANLRLMERADIPEVAALAKKVYRVRSGRWVRCLLDTGDIGVVATVGGRIAGFAFATVMDDTARFHTLTVAQDMRGRGIAKALMRARLHFAKDLGVGTVILEIADWNLPSLAVATSFGFKNAGYMYVETTRIKRVKKNIVRRW